MNDYKENKTIEGIKNFMQFNWFVLWGVLLVTTLINIIIAVNIFTSNKNIRQEIKEDSKKVVALSTTGQIIYAEKQMLDTSSKAFKEAVKNVLLNDLVVDATRVTKNFTVIPKNENDIVNAYAPLANFYEYYLSPKGKQDFVFYIRKIGKLVNQKNLVEKVVPVSTNITQYKGDTHGFSIQLVVNCAVTYYLEVADKNQNGLGAITIDATGHWNPAKGNLYNPLGIMFDSLKVSLITKPKGQ